MKFSIKNIFCKKTENQFIDFILIKCLTAIIYFSVLITLTEKFKIYYIFSAIIGGAIISVISFGLNKKITFKENLEKNFLKKYWRFGAINTVVGIFEISTLFILTEIIGIYYIISSIFITSTASITSFLTNKFLNFNK